MDAPEKWRIAHLDHYAVGGCNAIQADGDLLTENGVGVPPHFMCTRPPPGGRRRWLAVVLGRAGCQSLEIMAKEPLTIILGREASKCRVLWLNSDCFGARLPCGMPRSDQRFNRLLDHIPTPRKLVESGYVFHGVIASMIIRWPPLAAMARGIRVLAVTSCWKRAQTCWPGMSLKTVA